jgi:tyrosyl-tRNA synthetase
MSRQKPYYTYENLKAAILDNTVEVLPTQQEQLEDEIKFLVDQANETDSLIRHYIGFEISGQIHLGTGLSAALKIKQLQDAGVQCNIFLADYHTWLNNKLDGKLETIRTVAHKYFAPLMLECCRLVGCNTDEINIIFAETSYKENHNNLDFFTAVLDISKNLTLSRVLKSISITGKNAGENTDFGTLLYAPMQATDAFWFQTHIVHAGIDQRKCHVLMREIALKINPDLQLKIGNKSIKPIAIHHGLLLGLEAPVLNTETNVLETSKMSKSRPNSTIWVHDSIESIKLKIKKAYCPIPDLQTSLEERKSVQEINPLLNWCQHLLFSISDSLEVIRSEKFGGNKTYLRYEDLYSDYLQGLLHPMDLKNAVSEKLINCLKSMRDYVANNPEGLSLVQQSRK